MGKTAKVFLLSDSTGDTAEQVVRAAISQFDHRLSVEPRLFRYVNTEEKLAEVMRRASEEGALVVYTLVIGELRLRIVELAEVLSVKVIDLLGPLLDAFQAMVGQPPLGKPGLIRQMDEGYFKRVKAIEFAIACDDGKSPHMLKEAELVLIGVSRSSKTPLSMYLAHKGIMVANVPLVPEVPPPDELFQLDPNRVVGLLIKPENLVKIRSERLKVLGLDPESSSYASWERVVEELEGARAVMRKVGCKVVDVSDRAVEETAHEILEHMMAHGFYTLS